VEKQENAELATGALSHLSVELGSVAWKEKTMTEDGDKLYTLLLEDGARITVLDRLTGFGRRDVETGYRDKDDLFWLASGGFDIRRSEGLTIAEAIDLIKANANTCVAA
jgi:hypothetical protein